MWRVSSTDGKTWVEVDRGRVDGAGPALTAVLTGSGPIEVAPLSGVLYEPTGPRDETAMLLRARAVIGDNNMRTSGALPQLPDAGQAATGGPDRVH